VLSASGTAVRMRLPDEELSKREASLLPHAPFSIPGAPQYAGQQPCAGYSRASSGGRRVPPPCTIGHTPYSPAEAPFPVRIEPCAMCKRRHVPELLLATIDKPPWLPTLGHPCLIQVGWRATHAEAGGRGEGAGAELRKGCGAKGCMRIGRVRLDTGMRRVQSQTLDGLLGQRRRGGNHLFFLVQPGAA
jgi:hypothetical protein